MAQIIRPSWATSTAHPINQTAHGFTTGQQIYFDGVNWALAQANDIAKVRVGSVGQVIGPDHFLAVFDGILDWNGHGLTLGAMYYLSSVTAGGVTPTPPVATGTYRQPCLIPISPRLVRSLQYVEATGTGTTDRVLEFTRDFGATPANGRWAILRWDRAPTDSLMNYSGRVRLRIEGLDSGGAVINTSWYNMWIQINQASGNHAIKMLACSRPTNGGAFRLRITGNTAVPAQTNLVYENNTYAGQVEQWKITAWLDETCSPNPVDTLTIQSIALTNELARWEETDPIQVKLLDDLGDVNLTGVS